MSTLKTHPADAQERIAKDILIFLWGEVLKKTKKPKPKFTKKAIPKSNFMAFIFRI